jgi:hypothetical protein
MGMEKRDPRTASHTSAALSPAPGSPGEGWGGGVWGIDYGEPSERTPSLTLPRSTGRGDEERSPEVARAPICNLQFSICNLQSRRILAFLIVSASIPILFTTQSGCILGRQNPAATQPATAADPDTAKPAYWLDQPAVAHVKAADFAALWTACRLAAEADGFTIDRRDYREGLLTTQPLQSKQFYEFWRGDVRTAHDLAQSSLGMMRRTARFSIERLPDGTYQATPKVLVERDTLLQRRITSVDQYQNAFAVQQQDVVRESEKAGTDVAAEYWYSVGRDTALEHQLADAVRDRLPASVRR